MTRFWGLLRVLGFCFVLGFFVCVVFIFGGFFVCFLGVLFLGFALLLYFFFGGGGEGWFFFFPSNGNNKNAPKTSAKLVLL